MQTPPQMPEFEESNDGHDVGWMDVEQVEKQTGLSEAKIVQYFSQSGPGGYSIDSTHGYYKRLYSTHQVSSLIRHLEKILRVDERKASLKKMIERIEDASDPTVF